MSLREREIDERVIETCQQGDMAAFQMLFEAYNDKVFSIALSCCGDACVAKDITQIVFLKVFNNIGQFSFDARFETWLYRIVVNTCIDEEKKRKRLVPFSELTINDMSVKQSQEDRYVRRQVREAVKSVILSLNPKLRLPIILKYVEDLSYAEIAKVLGCSPGTVASRLNAGHKIIARKLAYLRDALDL
ncbi:MAG: sigma-70 family RNA polymerase sigma factor [Acidobacteriota bacterium]